ncbi:hypothetical protein NFI96_019991 [Prochilodus magdalenae]|nr:hypothetical protein NFI96_019991 [Prochilodus magdalenae]
MSEIPSSTRSKMDGKANSFIQKWLGLPRCLSETGLFGRNILKLPLQSISLGYKQEKTRLVLVSNAQTEVDQASSHLQHQEIVGRVQVESSSKAAMTDTGCKDMTKASKFYPGSLIPQT